jgi:hypothetical protein
MRRSRTRCSAWRSSWSSVLIGIYGFCSIFSMPVEVILRPQYGTRYFQPQTALFSVVAMLVLSMISEFASSYSNPLFIAAHIHREPQGLFGIGSLCELFIVVILLHTPRLYRRMIHMDLEPHSEFEGPTLFFFQLVPGGKSFYFTRIVLEPALVMIVAFVMNRLFIFRTDLEYFLMFSALCLALKSFVSWRVQWELIRKIMDAQFAAPVIASLLDDKASQKDLEQIHLASFPKDIPTDIRRSAAAYMAYVASSGATILDPKGDSNASH